MHTMSDDNDGNKVKVTYRAATEVYIMQTQLD